MSEIVKRIFQMSLDGKGVTTIARLLNIDKIPAFRSKLGWYSSTVRKILSSRSVIGEYQPCIYRKGMSKPEPVGEVFYDYFPAIIDKEIYLAVQARLSNGTHIAGRTAKIENIFGGITYCGYCGAKMDVVSNKRGKYHWRYLYCSNAKKGLGCSYISFRCSDLESTFFAFCKSDEMLDLLNSEGDEDRDRRSKILLQLSARQGELDILNKKIAILNDEFMNEDDKLMRENISMLLKKQLLIKAELDNSITFLSKDITIIDTAFENVETRVNYILNILIGLDTSIADDVRIEFRGKLRNALRQIISKVVIYPRGYISSDDAIERYKKKHEAEIQATDERYWETLQYEYELGISNMIQSKSNTKNDRYFEIFFKNGNFLRVEYIKDLTSYKMSMYRVGNTVEWSMGGKHMKPIIVDEYDDASDYDDDFDYMNTSSSF